jgi:hypothetical protein
MIEITHSATGEFKQFPDAQAIADFLASRQDAAEWTGWEFLGALPASTVQAAAPEAEHPPEPETLVERIEHAVEEVFHHDEPGPAAE